MSTIFDDIQKPFLYPAHPADNFNGSLLILNMSHPAIETLVQKISPPATLCNRWSQLVDVDKCQSHFWVETTCLKTV